MPQDLALPRAGDALPAAPAALAGPALLRRLADHPLGPLALLGAGLLVGVGIGVGLTLAAAAQPERARRRAARRPSPPEAEDVACAPTPSPTVTADDIGG